MTDPLDRERRSASDRRQSRRGGRRIADLATHDQAFITIEQLAEHLAVERRQILKWIRCETLPAYQFGRRYRIKLSEAVVFVMRQRLQRP